MVCSLEEKCLDGENIEEMYGGKVREREEWVRYCLTCPHGAAGQAGAGGRWVAQEGLNLYFYLPLCYAYQEGLSGPVMDASRVCGFSFANA